MTPSAASAVDDALGLRAQVAEQLLVLAEPARDQLGRRDLAAVGERQRRDDDQNAVLGEPPAVTQGDVLDVADTEAVDERHAGLDPVDDARDPTA